MKVIPETRRAQYMWCLCF